MRMLGIKIFAGSLFAAMLCLSTVAGAADLDPALQAMVSARTKEVQKWAADAAIVAAVKAYNESKSPQAAAMDQTKWTATSVIDPFVRGLTKNAAASVLKAKRDAVLTEAFVSGADGGKVAFLGKTSNWSHQGKPKHDQPMSGKTWQGDVEIDASSGLRQLQVAVPVLDGGKPIGSLVVGLSVGQMAN